MEIIKSACGMCHGGCGVLIHRENQEVVKITGDPDSPLNKGKLCRKALAGIEHLNHPRRLKSPLRRCGAKGEGKWQPISWDEALDEIVTKIEAAKTRFGAESIVIGQGTGRHHFHHVVGFANALGTPNWIEPGSAQCFVPRMLTTILTYGSLPICDYYGNQKPECILVWGHNPIISGPDGEIQFLIKESLKAGSRLIVVDPRQTDLAKRAEIWLRIKPGTDAALALGMIHVMIEEDLIDHEFVRQWTVGMDELSEQTKSFTPNWVEKETWVPARQIREAARLFAKAKPATLEWGTGIEQTPNSLQAVRSISILPAITGNIDIPGGWILGADIMPEVSAFSPRLPNRMQEQRLGAAHHRLLSGRHSPWPSAHVPSVFQAMMTGDPYPITMFINFGNNALVSYADSRRVHQALMSLDFMVSMDLYMTPSCELSDIVLPAASWLEFDRLLPVPFNASHVVLAGNKVATRWECRSDESVLLDLKKRLKLVSPDHSLNQEMERQLNEMKKRYPSLNHITSDTLKKQGSVSVPITYHKYQKNGFATPSGKIELASSNLRKMGYDELPSYKRPPESGDAPLALEKEYPLILTTGGRMQSYFNSEFRQISSLRSQTPDPIVEIHPKTAKNLNIKDGDWIRIETPRGRIKQKAKFSTGMDKRVVNVQYGWWFPEKESPSYGVWDSNANVLTKIDPPYDPALGTYQLRALRCKVYALSTEDPCQETIGQTNDTATDTPLSIDFDL